MSVLHRPLVGVAKLLLQAPRVHRATAVLLPGTSNVITGDCGTQASGRPVCLGDSARTHHLSPARERYPWHLGAFVSASGPLPDGDYALVSQGTVAAVAERKTFDGLLAESVA